MEGLLYIKNLIITLALGLSSFNRGFCYIKVFYIDVVLHTFYCNFGRAEEYCLLYQGLR